ncbi:MULTISPECIES: dihydropyrimidinase [Lachnospiraceae]|uniref:Dihydropyrimidinase n=1 Tax=Faecalicatena acetigenes TaxID=2981790 RepID=A0ABT2T992_9FIRM|nr:MULTISPECIES: dihydropyrimidinase [Lachnospiraceae]MCU6746843.1 dihydropyrimidinase [Faecalicatena acetigenes]RGT72815.1 dihydropyrimidinase [Ruminococcus sp. AF18-22]SCH47039.1 D-phenylhydantoinase [uncultured Clostridium sp.]
MKKIIKNGTIATDSHIFQSDILIEDGIIREIGESLSAPDAEILDASGKYVIPGAVDVHTHMDLQAGKYRAVDDFFSGTVAAACGGTTSIVDHMAFGPQGCSLWHQVEEYHRLADNKAVVDYGFHGVIQHVDPSVLKEMKEIADNEGITSFKIYMTYDFMLKDDEIYQVLKQAKKEDIVIAVHCENDGVVNHLRRSYIEQGCTQPKYHPLSRPARCEAEAVNRMLHLAAMAGDAPVYIVHLSSKEGLLEIQKAKAAQQKHFAVETCPQYLTLTDALYQDDQEGLKAIMSPPLRKEEDTQALWQALHDDVLDVVATDHCPFLFSREKQAGADDFTACPNGAPGVEERLRILFSEGVLKKRITLPQMVKYLCTNPSRLYGLYPQKGTLLPGSDADIVILDPSKERILTQADMHGAGDYTCYEGWKVKGDIELVMLRGNTIVKNNQFLGKKGDGHYLRRHKSELV